MVCTIVPNIHHSIYRTVSTKNKAFVLAYFFKNSKRPETIQNIMLQKEFVQ